MATIASEMGEAVKGSLHYNSLFAVGLVLFVYYFYYKPYCRYVFAQEQALI